jgi:hypothetical protein
MMRGHTALKRFGLRLVLLIGIGCASSAALAATCTSAASGPWTTIGWTGGCPAGPLAGDAVVIRTADTVTLNTNPSPLSSLLVNGTLTFGNSTTAQTLTVTGNITVAGTVNVSNNTASHSLNAGGDITSTGTFNLARDADSVCNTVFTGAGTRAVAGSGGTTLFNNVTVNSGVTVNVTNNITVAGATTVDGTLGLTAAAGTKTFTGNVIVNGTWTNSANDNVALGGSLTNNGTFTAGTGVYTLQGAAQQVLSGTAGATSFSRLTLNNAAGLSLSGTHDLAVTGTLTLTSGKITTGANAVVVPNCTFASIGGAGGSRFVEGNLRRTVPAGNNVLCVFPVGTGTSYTPATLLFASVTTSGTVTASTTAGAHPDLGTSGLDTATPHKLNRYWTLTNGAVAFTSYTAAFTYVAADVDANADPLAFIATRYAGGAWNPTTEGGVTATSITINAETGFGDFAAGETLGYNSGLGRFNAYDPAPATPANSVHGNIRTKIAATGFSLTVVHLNNAGDALTGIGGNVIIDLMDASDNSGALTNNCGLNWTVIRSVTVAFGGNSSRTVNFTVANTETNAWKEVRVRASSGGQRGCSGDRFAIRPASFDIVASDADWASAGTGRSLNATAYNGTPVHKAGQPFSLRVSSVAPGGASNYVSAGNHSGAPSLRDWTCTVPSGASPACSGCVTGAFSAGSFSVTGGQLISNTASYKEAGTFNLSLHDATYAAVDTADTPATYSNTAPYGRFVPQTSAAIAVGRFVPDHFSVAKNNTPQFQTFGSSCAAPRSFTYVGQAFGYVTAPQALVTAQEAGGETTQNYGSCFWNISTSSPSDVSQTYSNNAVGSALDTGLANNAPAITPLNNGTGTITLSSSDRIAYQRDQPVPPFTANISLGVAVRDDSQTDGSISSNTATFNGTGAGIAFDSGAEVRFGRLRMLGASGSRNAALPVRMRTEYWDANAFVVNGADSCTAIARSNVALSGGLVAPTCLTLLSTSAISFASGVAAPVLAAPGASGSVDLRVNLGGSTGSYCSAAGSSPATADTAGRAYLQGRWDSTDQAGDGALYDDDPVARATFGIYGQDRLPNNVIFRRENF